MNAIHEFLAGLRYPALLKFTLTLLLIDLVIPDLIPFIDELLLLALSILFARWKRPANPDAPQDKLPPPRG